MIKTTLTPILKVTLTLAAFACSATAFAKHQRKPPHPPSDRPPPVAAELPPRLFEPRDPPGGEPSARGGRPPRGEGDRADIPVPNRRNDPSLHPRNQNWRPQDRKADITPLPRLKKIPTLHYWDVRYSQIYYDLGRLSRKGYIPVTAVPSNVYDITDYAAMKSAGKYAGWKGYGFIVPPNESIAISLNHPNKPWFRLLICDKWGDPVPGALGSLHPQPPVPKLTCTNHSREAKVIYVIVDDPGWMSDEGNPYSLEVARSWNPDLFPEDLSSIVSGIWGLELSVNAQFQRPMAVMPGFR